MPKKDILKLRDKTDKYTIEKEQIPDLPFRMIISAPSGMGKTNFICNLLLRDVYYKKDFDPDYIFIFSGSLSEQKIQTLINQLDIPSSNLFSDYDELALEAIYDMLVNDFNEAIENKKKPKQSLIILDDLGYKALFKNTRKNNQVDRLFCNGRKYLISTILILQRYTQVSTTCRSNLTTLVLGKVPNKELNLVEEDLNYLDDKNKFKKMVRDNTEDKRDFMIFNLSKPEIYQNKNFETIDIKNL